MIKQLFSGPRLELGLAGALFLVAVPPAAAQITVSVNGRPVEFGAVQPARIGGRVLIPLRAGSQVHVTLIGTPGAGGSFEVGSLAKDVPLREDPQQPGRYTGTFTVREGDQAIKAPVSVELLTPDGRRVRQQATAPVNVVTVEPRPPVITAPADRFALEDELVVEGTGVPGSKVIVEITYTGKAFGALPVKGTFGSREVTVGRNGKWATEPFPVRLPLGVRRPTLRIQAVTVDAAGTKSRPAVLTVETR